MKKLLIGFTALMLMFSCKDDDDQNQDPCIGAGPSALSSNCENSIWDSPNPPTEIFKTVEVMPTFPGCEHIGNNAERRACSDSTMLAYINEHLEYPEEAKEKGIEGMVVVTFVVDTTGCLGGIEVVQNIGCGCGKEAKRVVQAMPFWNPGKQVGTKVPVQYNLPVSFEL